MQKQNDVKSQTSGPFALTLQGIKGYGQLNQQQCWTTRLTVKQSSVLKKKKLACMSLYSFLSHASLMKKDTLYSHTL